MARHGEAECCEVYEVHPERVLAASAQMPEENELSDVADLFKVFGDTTRLRILFVLFREELCVCDIAQTLGMTQSAISHQLRILKQFRLVRNRRDGKQVLYSLADAHVETIIAQGRDHIEEKAK